MRTDKLRAALDELAPLEQHTKDELLQLYWLLDKTKQDVFKEVLRRKDGELVVGLARLIVK